MKKVIISLILVLMLSSCNNIGNYKVKYYNMGNINEINIKKDSINKCLDSVFDLYKLILSPDNIEIIKEQENGIEVLLAGEINYNFKQIKKNKKFTKFFIPYSGKYKNMLFLGDSEGYGAYPPLAIGDSCNFLNKQKQDLKIDKDNQETKNTSSGNMSKEEKKNN